MSKIRLYLDEDTMSGALLEALLARGVDVVTVADVKRRGFPDKEQLEWALSQGRVICSANVGDFMQLHTEFISNGKDHAGIILIQQKISAVGDRLRGLMKIIESKTAEDMHNQLEFLGRYLR